MLAHFLRDEGFKKAEGGMNLERINCNTHTTQLFSFSGSGRVDKEIGRSFGLPGNCKWKGATRSIHCTDND